MKNSSKILFSLITLSIFAFIAIGSSESAETTAEKNKKYIKGLMPVDVYLNFEKIGFNTEKQLNPEYGNLWVNKLSENGIDYIVETYSDNIENVISVRATANIMGQKDIVATKQFFKFFSSLPFDNNDTEKVQKWIDENFNNDKASIIIGDVKYTIYAPTKFARMMRIDKYNGNENTTE